MDGSTPGFPVFHHLPDLLILMSFESVMPSNHLILCPPPSPQALNLSRHQGLCIRWTKYWSFSFSISPSNEYSALISFMIDWFGFLAVQGTLKSLIQHHNESIMAPHSSTLAWKIPWTEEPGRLQSMGSLGVGHD